MSLNSVGETFQVDRWLGFGNITVLPFYHFILFASFDFGGKMCLSNFQLFLFVGWGRFKDYGFSWKKFKNIINWDSTDIWGVFIIVYSDISDPLHLFWRFWPKIQRQKLQNALTIFSFALWIETKRVDYRL